MSFFNFFKCLGMALFLITALTPNAWSAVEHQEHTNDKKTESGLNLNNGELWPTDLALRTGMQSIQNDMAEALPAIHSGSMTDKHYFVLAKKIHSHVDDIIKSCKLSPEADGQLHIILGEIIKGTLIMESQTTQASGAAMIVHALDLYGRYFKHADWKPLTH